MATQPHPIAHIVVVGASLAGLRAVEQLRKSGYEGLITLLGAEEHLPYDRPPLSKAFLLGTADASSVTFRASPHFEQLRVELILGQRAAALDLHQRKVHLANSSIGFDGLILATGSMPRDIRLPGRELDGIHLLRTFDDAQGIRAAFSRGPRVAIIGAGVIGAEVASSARALGLDVTLVEAQTMPMQRSIGPVVGPMVAKLHEGHGIRSRYGVSVSAFEGAGRVERVRLSDGSGVAADLVVIGAGVVPCVDWLKSSGLPLENGLRCDARLRAGGFPNVYAAGDMVRWHNPLFQEDMRQETWTSAVEQGMQAAKNLLAGESAQDCATVPYFWSDQCGVRIQVAGRCHGDEIQVVDGSLLEGRFLALVRRKDRLEGVIGINSARLLMSYRAQIGRKVLWKDALAASQAVSTCTEGAS